MTVPIDVAAGLIVLASLAVGYAVWRHTRTTCPTVPKTGDIGTAFTAGSVTLVALAFLFGVTPNQGGQHDDHSPPPGVNASPVPGPGTTTAPEPGPPPTGLAEPESWQGSR